LSLCETFRSSFSSCWNARPLGRALAVVGMTGRAGGLFVCLFV